MDKSCIKKYVIDECLKYESLQDFKELSPTVYNYAFTNNLVDINLKWDYLNCLMEARKYKTLREFRNGCRYAHDRSYAKGWIKDFYWLKKNHPNGHWTDYMLRNEASKYTTKKGFYTNSRSAYSLCCKKGLIKHFDWLK